MIEFALYWTAAGFFVVVGITIGVIVAIPLIELMVATVLRWRSHREAGG
jgi:hypothetical protein